MDQINQHHGDSPSVIIIGGGIAGIAAAVRLIPQGYHITLLERRPFLGGRASSVWDPMVNEWVDNCQHILMGCCYQLQDLFTHLGTQSLIKWYDKYQFLTGAGEISEIKSSWLPAPFHLMPSFLKFTGFNWAEKKEIMQAFMEIWSMNDTAVKQYESIPFIQWLKEHQQSGKTIQTFWIPVIISALNENLESVSTSYVLKVLKMGFLGMKQDYRLGIPKTPLGTLYHQAAMRYLQEQGVVVRLETVIDEIQYDHQEIIGITLQDGTELKADAYISATNFHQLYAMLPKEIQSEHPFSQLQELENSPITGIHLWWDRPITEFEHLCLPGRFLQWMFNRTAISGIQNGTRQYLSFVVSASNDLMSMSREEIIQRTLDDVYEMFPKARQANLVYSRVIKENRATFRPLSGVDTFRMGHQSIYSNLFLAGDWTQTDWPSTMESAVISGYATARLMGEALRDR